MSHQCLIHFLWFLFPGSFKRVFLNLLSLYTENPILNLYESLGFKLECLCSIDSLFTFIVIQTSLRHRDFCDVVPFVILFNLLVNQLMSLFSSNCVCVFSSVLVFLIENFHFNFMLFIWLMQNVSQIRVSGLKSTKDRRSQLVTCWSVFIPGKLLSTSRLTL